MGTRSMKFETLYKNCKHQKWFPSMVNMMCTLGDKNPCHICIERNCPIWQKISDAADEGKGI